VIGHDPEAAENFKREIGSHPSITYAKSAYGALEGADALVLVTEWSEYKRPNWDKVKTLMRSHVVFDFRNQYSADSVREAGFIYYCVGRP
jgi:UDPglucose 6-dehydrogenase